MTTFSSRDLYDTLVDADSSLTRGRVMYDARRGLGSVPEKTQSYLDRVYADLACPWP